MFSSRLLSLSNLSGMRSILLIIFTALPHVSMCAMWASCDVRCRYLEHFFSGLSCFCSGGAGLASPGRSALASVPELHVSSFRHASWLNFTGFRSSGDLFAYRILLSTIICDIAVLLVLIVAVSCLAFWRFWETIRVTLFIDDSVRTIVCPDAFVLHSKISSRSVLDDVCVCMSL